MMKLRWIAVLCFWVIGAGPLMATNVGISAIEQPINLGAHSDPTRIPLGRVAVEANYTYGIYNFIDAPRACPDGAMEWAGGSELDQNLASVFGIKVELGDSTMLLHEENVLRVKDWEKPAYSPYSKEQVLAATLWCLIRNSGCSEKHPLKIKVVVEGEGDQTLVEKYSGSYFCKRDEKGKVVEFPKVPGTRLELDPMGFTWVVFPGVDTVKDFDPIAPVMIPMEMGGESGDSGWWLAPIWGNGKQKTSLKLTSWTANMLYSAYESTGVRNANTFHAAGGAHSMWVDNDGSGVEVRYLFPAVDSAIFTANVWALIMSSQPTEASPLKVTIRFGDEVPEDYIKLATLADWKIEKREGTAAGSYLSAEFVWNSKEHKLTRGKLPWYTADENGWISWSE